jgi:predicted CoA-binding protein
MPFKQIASILKDSKTKGVFLCFREIKSMPVPEQFLQILKNAKTIAVVGLSDKPDRPSYEIARYLQSQGYRIIPINPKVESVLGEKAYKSILDVPKEIQIDIVDVFRRSEEVLPVVEEAIQRKVGCIWLQLGISNEEAYLKAQEAGIPMIMDTCIAVTHNYLRSRGL